MIVLFLCYLNLWCCRCSNLIPIQSQFQLIDPLFFATTISKIVHLRDTTLAVPRVLSFDMKKKRRNVTSITSVEPAIFPWHYTSCCTFTWHVRVQYSITSTASSTSTSTVLYVQVVLYDNDSRRSTSTEDRWRASCRQRVGRSMLVTPISHPSNVEYLYLQRLASEYSNPPARKRQRQQQNQIIIRYVSLYLYLYQEFQVLKTTLEKSHLRIMRQDMHVVVPDLCEVYLIAKFLHRCA